MQPEKLTVMIIDADLNVISEDSQLYCRVYRISCYFKCYLFESWYTENVYLVDRCMLISKLRLCRSIMSMIRFACYKVFSNHTLMAIERPLFSCLCICLFTTSSRLNHTQNYFLRSLL